MSKLKVEKLSEDIFKIKTVQNNENYDHFVQNDLINRLASYNIEGNIYQISEIELNNMLRKWSTIPNKNLIEMSGHEFSYIDKYIDEKIPNKFYYKKSLQQSFKQVFADQEFCFKDGNLELINFVDQAIYDKLILHSEKNTGPSLFQKSIFNPKSWRKDWDKYIITNNDSRTMIMNKMIGFVDLIKSVYQI